LDGFWDWETGLGRKGGSISKFLLGKGGRELGRRMGMEGLHEVFVTVLITKFRGFIPL